MSTIKDETICTFPDTTEITVLTEPYLWSLKKALSEQTGIEYNLLTLMYADGVVIPQGPLTRLGDGPLAVSAIIDSPPITKTYAITVQHTPAPMYARPGVEMRESVHEYRVQLSIPQSADPAKLMTLKWAFGCDDGEDTELTASFERGTGAAAPLTGGGQHILQFDLEQLQRNGR